MDFDDPRFLRILDAAGELGLIVTVHAGLDVGFPGETQAVPRKIRNALRAVGPLTLICAHMGGWRCWEEAAELLSDTGAYIDTSFSLGPMTPNGDGYYRTPEELALMDGAEFLSTVRAFGADRVLFGTDCPWGAQKDALARFLALPLSPPEREAILHGNAERLIFGKKASV